WYLLSKLYFTNNYSKFNIDSAYQFALTSQRIFGQSSLRQKERVKKLPLDSLILVNHLARIDSAAFDRAKQNNTEQAYIEFLQRFPKAKEKTAAIELRDEVAFVQALKINTFSSFQNYLKKYPASLRADDAKARYEKLLFDDKTKEATLKSYEAFLDNYPNTTYRREAERNIFEISTAMGSSEAFVAFIRKHPGSHFRKEAIDILYHLTQQDEQAFEFSTDSLRQASILEKGYWVPIMVHDRFGFMDNQGHEVIAPQFTSISQEYICGDVRTDYLIVENGIIGRNGKWIFHGKVEDAEDMGSGFLRVGKEDSLYLVHKSGFTLTRDFVEDTKIIAENFIAIKKNEFWSLVSFTGKALLPSVYENIETIDGLIVLSKRGKKIITTAKKIAAVADKNILSETFVFDEVRLLERGTYLVKNGPLEGAINNSLEYIVPLDRQLLTKVPLGFLSERNKKFLLKGVAPVLEGKEFDQIRFYGNWIALHSAYNLQLFELGEKKVITEDLDSLWFSNRMAFTTKNDSIKTYLLSGKSMGFSSRDVMVFISSPDTINYLYTIDKKKKAVFDISTGTRLFDVDADAIEYVGFDLFLITRKEVKGLIGRDGKVVLPIEYASVVPSGKKFVSLLKDKKFGLFDLEKRMLIKPEYTRNVIPFNDHVFVAFKDGFYGFVNEQAKPLSKFEFEEIKNWNDTTALVRKNFSWFVYSI
ncbi:MAG TPA: WG repeat-containing protein, partial [Cyclobacteriaceae bacterium]|nr:WG repeat-containing protein [Cyclobacteriaceae bacterium]